MTIGAFLFYIRVSSRNTKEATLARHFIKVTDRASFSTSKND